MLMNLFSRLQQLEIVLIEDDEWIQDSMRILFEGEGCELRIFDTAEEAVAVLETKMADIVMADYRLPGMNGIEFFNRIKHITGKSPAKILISAYLNRSVREASLKAGVHAVIEKPFTSETIESTLDRIVNLA